jgi:hypothetical protein
LFRTDQTKSKPETPLLFSVSVFDNGTGVKNATLFYSTNSSYSEKYMPKDLMIQAPMVSPDVYKAVDIIPSLYDHANLTYYIESFDYAGNKNISDTHYIPFIDSKFSKVNSNEIKVNATGAKIKVKHIDSSSLTGEIEIAIEAKEVTEFNSYDTLFGSRPPIQVLNVNGNFTVLSDEFEKIFLLVVYIILDELISSILLRKLENRLNCSETLHYIHSISIMLI